jgi:predicted nucleotidyltransferase
MNALHSPLFQLEGRLGVKWQHLRAAKERSIGKRSELLKAIRRIDSDDVSVVVFGSLARDEFTEQSDIDWTLLVDGGVDPQHLSLAARIEAVIAELADKPVGREGTFGNLAFSHELVHQIGGQGDSNQNTTRRILLLLESVAVGRSDAYDRVLKAILSRYLLEDRGFVSGSGSQHVPRFLFNDFARYWWTMAVDFAHKQRTRFGQGAAIRNLKLRMSRKLIYISGMLTCFGCALYKKDDFGECPNSRRTAECVECLRQKLNATPLEIVADTFLRFPHLNATALKLISSYDAFLGILATPEARARLDKIQEVDYAADPVYQEARALSHEFRAALLELFFDEVSGLSELTKMYGVF